MEKNVPNKAYTKTDVVLLKITRTQIQQCTSLAYVLFDGCTNCLLDDTMTMERSS